MPWPPVGDLLVKDLRRVSAVSAGAVSFLLVAIGERISRAALWGLNAADGGCLKTVGWLGADRMVFCERVSGVSGNDVTDPTKRAASSNPETGSNDKPENAGQNPAVVQLAHAGN